MKDFSIELHKLENDVDNEIYSLIQGYNGDNDNVLNIDVTIEHGMIESTVASIYIEDDDSVAYVVYDDGETVTLDGFGIEDRIAILNGIINALSKKVYVLVYVDVSETLDEQVIVKTFDSRDEAREALNEIRDNVKKNTPEWFEKDYPCREDFTDTEDAFIAWEDGYYNNNHVRAEIYERLVKK